MTTTPSLNPQVLGQAENAHRGLLDRILAETGITYHQWVALTVTSVRETTISRRQLAERMTRALRIDEAMALEAIDELSAAELLDARGDGSSRVQLTDAGRERHRQIRTAIDETITHLYEHIPAEDLATAGRVLTLITARAKDELARSGG
jgi:DNA-binding MarR family transcriptional regulator